MTQQHLGAFSHVTAGVANLTAALELWTKNFGLELCTERTGADPALAALWGIAPAAIARQALLMTPGAAAGGLHLVEFLTPGPAVRAGAQNCDQLPKSLDLYTRDMPARCAELEAAGYGLRGPWMEIPAGEGPAFREVHLAGHDEINIVLLEIFGPGYATPLSPRGYAGIGPLITVVDDCRSEKAFYREALGLTSTLELLIRGPEIERTVGLPPGAGLDVSIFGDPAEPLGRIEVIEYQGVRGENRYARAIPPATGILHVNYRVADLAPIRARLNAARRAFRAAGQVDALYGRGPVLCCRSPAGLRIEIQQASGFRN